MQTANIVMLVDGDSASGKGTVATHLANHFNLAYLDTGLIYRAVGLLCHRAGVAEGETTRAAAIAADFCAKGDLSILADPDIKTVEAGFYGTLYGGQNAEVRQQLFEFQIDFCRRNHTGKAGAVLDGRHLAFEIWPAAQVKFYITASPAVRAERRRLQLEKLGLPAHYTTILDDIDQRDTRNNTMLMKKLGLQSVVAPDAFYIDSTALSVAHVLEGAVNAANKRLGLQ
jgi:cytidylate kinase